MNAAVEMFHVEQFQRPRRHLRDQSRASNQTKWIMEATAAWWSYYGDGPTRLLGVPSENILYRAALMIPRSPGGSPTLPEPSAIAAAVEQARRGMRDSRWRVIVGNEKNADKGVEYVARKLGMSVSSTRDYLKEARQSLADVLRGMGWSVPINE